MLRSHQTWGRPTAHLHLASNNLILPLRRTKRTTLRISLLRFCLFIFRERGREKERERNLIGWLPLAHPRLGTWAATQACVLTGNRIDDLSFSLWDDGQATEPHQSVLPEVFLKRSTLYHVCLEHSKHAILVLLQQIISLLLPSCPGVLAFRRFYLSPRG